MAEIKWFTNHDEFLAYVKGEVEETVLKKVEDKPKKESGKKNVKKD